MFIHLFRPLTHSPSYIPSRPKTPSTPPPLYTSPILANSPHRHTQKLQARYPLSKGLSLDVKKMIFIVRMIVNVRNTL